MNMTNSVAVNPEKTLDLLWTRVRQRGDLPGFSRVVGMIVGAMRGDNDREFNMTRTVLSDPALTQRVLRLANSPMYSVFGCNINTVSKAVIVLGTDSIGHLALGLKLIDGLADASATMQGARGEMERALTAGHVAREVASATTMHDSEEAVVCSMLHSLGRMMTAFYLPELWKLVNGLSASGATEEVAAHKILGLGLEAIGRLVGQRWGLPAPLLDSMRDVAPHSADEPLDHAGWLAAVSTLSTRCADVLCAPGAVAPDANAIMRLSSAYAPLLGMEPELLMAAIDTGRANARNDLTFAPSPQTGLMLPASGTTVAGKPADAAQQLARGVADMRTALTTMSTVQLLTMALETVYKGLGFSRTVAFLRNTDESRYVGRLFLGDGVHAISPRLAFPDGYQPDVFHAALANDKMIFIENASEPAFQSKLPRWFKEALPSARSFMVLPLTINRHPVGLIYGDWDLSLPPAKINYPEVVPLDQLRVLLMRAIEQRRQLDPGWGRGVL
jgi:HD-like signal output (HDOD) protein